MAPTSTQTLLSPAELSYLHSSLSLAQPIRADGRSPTTFRPLTAEMDILPSANGSARICFADGTEAIVGVKAEVEKSPRVSASTGSLEKAGGVEDVDMKAPEDGEPRLGKKGHGHKDWVEMSIDVPGFRDDDALPIFLASLLNETLHARGELVDKLYINRRFHWKLFIDVSRQPRDMTNLAKVMLFQVILLSPPLSYPVPLLSLTVHLALLSTALPALTSTGEEDPMFNDDWEAASPLYPASAPGLPPITLLVVVIGGNIIFDPSKEELAVADSVLAISLAKSGHHADGTPELSLLALRTVDPPSRMTAPGLTDAQSAGGEETATSKATQAGSEGSVWTPPSGGTKRGLVSRAVNMCLGKDGVANEVLIGLQNFQKKA